MAVRERAAVPLALVALLALDLALGLAYASATPVWQNPDEPAHYNYVAYVAQTGGLPELRPGDWDSALIERLKTGQLQPADSIQVSTIRYESWQPPLYYLVAAQLFRAGEAADPLREMRLLRRLDVLFGGLTLLVGYLAGRELFPHSRCLALAVPLAMAGVPMFSSVSSAISADPLANLLAAALVVLLLRGLRIRLRQRATGTRDERPSSGMAMRAQQLGCSSCTGLLQRGWAVGTGVLLGLGLLTKLALAIFIPLALGVALWRARAVLREAATLLVAPVVLVAPWLVHQVTTYGWLDPFATARHAQVVQDQPRFPGLSAGYVAAFLTTTFHSFWAQFGWMAIPAPDRLYWIWGMITLLGAVGVLLAVRRPEEASCWRLMGAIVLLAVLAYVGYNLAYLQLQGRYLFIGLVPICALLVRGWAAWLPPRTQSVAPLALGALLVVLNVYALTHVLEPGFGH